MDWKKIPFLLLLVLFTLPARAQEKFFNVVSDTSTGSYIHLIPVSDGGFGVFYFTLNQEIRLIKFDPCGHPEWSKTYLSAHDNASLSDFIALKNGGFALLCRIHDGDLDVPLVAHLDPLGAVTWAKKYRDDVYNHYPYSLGEDSQGNLFVYENVQAGGSGSLYNAILKLNSNGKLLKTHFYNHGGIWGGAIVTSDDGLLARTGNIFIKVDKNGAVEWTSSLQLSTYYYYAPVEVADGYVFSGQITSAGVESLFKLDKQGNLVRGIEFSGGNSFPPAPLRNTSNGNILTFLHPTQAGKPFTRLVILDKNLNLVSQNVLNPSQDLLGAFDAVTGPDGYQLLTGRMLNSNKLFVAKTGPDLSLECDTTLSSFSLLPDSGSQMFISTNHTEYAFGTVNHSLPDEAGFPTDEVLCLSPKTLDLGPDTTFCANGSFTLSNLSGDPFETWYWSTGASTPSIQVQKPGDYWVIATYNCGQSLLRDTIHLDTLPVRRARLGPDTVYCNREPYELQAPLCPDCQLTWSNGSTENSILIADEGLYWLEVQNPNGCVSRDTVEVNHSRCIEDLAVPNVFSPNGDGFNDLFQITDPGVTSLQTSIFDRWGHEIYTTTDPQIKWKGEGVNEGVYFWVLRYTYINGNAGSLRGHVTLLR
ncbi:MAG: gliding motility-associated C-terminal domain-containing protein [Bacteroidia bacterium]|nr:gliding motility-associated C-terminal domain-containing protein [Bacteroidia bacterium]